MRLAVICLLLPSFSTFTRADVVYNNLASSLDADSLTQNSDNSPHIGFAQQFVTAGSFSNLEVVINLFKSGSTSGTFTIKLFDNTSGKPSGIGIELGTGIWNQLGTSRTNQFSLSAAFATKSQGTYWLAVMDNNPSLSHRWALGSTRPYDSPISGDPLETAGYVTGLGWINLGQTIPLGAQIVAVPEPGTMLLGGIAALTASAGYFWKRRRNQPRQEKSEFSLPEANNPLAI